MRAVQRRQLLRVRMIKLWIVQDSSNSFSVSSSAATTIRTTEIPTKVPKDQNILIPAITSQKILQNSPDICLIIGLITIGIILLILILVWICNTYKTYSYR